MNIKRAKEEIKHSIQAYLSKNEYGEYRIPAIRQRPLLLIGPPGIGKTQIMEQVAKECGVGLVAYTITHHTRQSAVGLPFIKEKEFGGETYSVTEYTMSEIIASVYEKVEQTGIREGILFIDEINCVSETLAPTMLQFLQCKTFGNQQVPEGWIIVAAGNPPEYNRSVREFDVVTLDRIKLINVEADFAVWKEYAYQAGIHNAIISYLELKKDHFYRVETTVDGKLFATARGWEDLSQLIGVYEDLNINMDREVIYQYIQHWKIAKDFANYLELYYKYQKDYNIHKILKGHISEAVCDRIRRAGFDERLSVIGLLIAALHEKFKDSYRFDGFVTGLYEQMKIFRDLSNEKNDASASELFAGIVKAYETETQRLKRAEQLTKENEHDRIHILKEMERLMLGITAQNLSVDQAFAWVKQEFEQNVSYRQEQIDETEKALDHVFDFMEKTFGNSQEMVIFITELNTDFFAVWYIDQNGCDRYYQYNKSLLFSEKQKGIMQELQMIEDMIPGNTSL